MILAVTLPLMNTQLSSTLMITRHRLPFRLFKSVSALAASSAVDFYKGKRESHQHTHQSLLETYPSAHLQLQQLPCGFYSKYLITVTAGSAHSTVLSQRLRKPIIRYSSLLYISQLYFLYFLLHILALGFRMIFV